MAESGESVPTLNEQIEYEIKNLDVQIRRHLGNSVSATYRCSTCSRLSLEHNNENVKGCKSKALTDDEYMQSITLQRDELAAAVTCVSDAHSARLEVEVLTRRAEEAEGRSAELQGRAEALEAEKAAMIVGAAL